MANEMPSNVEETGLEDWTCGFAAPMEDKAALSFQVLADEAFRSEAWS